MFFACVVISGVLAFALVGSAMAKLRRMEQVVVPITSVGVPLDWFPWLAALELLGAAGLIIGLFVPAIGIAAATGVIIYFVGAVIAHLRAGDSTIAAPAFLAFMAVGALVLRIYSI
jgi:DoxX-like family